MMFTRLADLAQRRGKRVLVLAAVLFVAAAAFGAGVADHLAPYGADDPNTESVRADSTLEDAGYRQTGLVLLVDGVDVSAAAGRERVAQLADELRDQPEIATVSSYLDDRSKDFVSNDGDSTYIAASMKPTDDKEAQDAAERIAGTFEDEPGVTVGGGALSQAQANSQVESD